MAQWNLSTIQNIVKRYERAVAGTRGVTRFPYPTSFSKRHIRDAKEILRIVEQNGGWSSFIGNMKAKKQQPSGVAYKGPKKINMSRLDNRQIQQMVEASIARVGVNTNNLIPDHRHSIQRWVNSIIPQIMHAVDSITHKFQTEKQRNEYLQETINRWVGSAFNQNVINVLNRRGSKMPQNERDEILSKYSESLKPKQAWDAVDFFQELATEVPAGLAIDLGVGAAITWAGSALLPGVGAAGAGAFVAGTPLLTLLGGPVGLVLGTAFAVGAAIYNVSKLTDDNLNDLVSRLNALDPNERAEPVIKDWIAKLESFKPILAMPLTTTDPKERVAANKQKLDGMTALHQQLQAMQTDWPQVKQNLTDWGLDAGQAETALQKTTMAMRQGLEQIKQQTQKSVQEFVAKAGEAKKENYPELAKSVTSKWEQLTKQYGKAPEFENKQEEAGFNLAQSIIAGKATMEGFEANINNMIMLNNLLDTAIKSTAAFYPRISKRSLLLGDGKSVTLRGITEKGKERGVALKDKKPDNISQVTKSIQKNINHLAAVYLPQAGFIKEDGIYGPETGGMLSGIMTKSRGLERMVRQHAGMAIRNVEEYKYIRRDVEKLAALDSVLRNAVQQTKGDRGVAYKGQRKTEEPVDVARSFRKSDPTPMEIDAHLRRMMVTHKGERMSAYQFLRYYAGINTPEGMARIIRKVFGRGGEIPAPIEWTGQSDHLVKSVTRSFPDARGRFSIV